MRSLNWCLIYQSEMDKEVVVTLKKSFILGNQPKYLTVLMIVDIMMWLMIIYYALYIINNDVADKRGLLISFSFACTGYP